MRGARSLTLLLAIISPSIACADDELAGVKVLKVYRLEPTARSTSVTDKPEAARVGLGDRIQVDVQNLSKLTDLADQKKKPIVLFLDSMPVKGVFEKARDKGNNWLQFDMTRTDTSKDTWTLLLGRPTSYEREVSVSVGLEDIGPVATDPVASVVSLVVLRRWWLIGWTALMGILLITLLYCAIKTTMLRDSGFGLPANTDGKRSPKNAWSLARCQMAVWTVLVIGAFTFIWAVTGSLDSITESILGLMGIATGTFLGSAVVDSSKRGIFVTQIHDLSAEKHKLEVESAPAKKSLDVMDRLSQARSALAELDKVILGSGPEEGKSKASVNKVNLLGEISLLEYQKAQITTNPDDLRAFLAKAETRIGQINQQVSTLLPSASAVPTSGNIFRDLVNDSSGPSLHRLQMVAWTAVLAIIFARSVYSNLAMPDFSATLLALMGISSGTYVGFKIPEK